MAADHDVSSGLGGGRGGTAAREWDAQSYDRISTPQQRWAGPVLDQLRPDGVELVVDAGCGTGRVTQMLLDRLPAAHVVAVDGSRQMLATAARRLAPAVAAGHITFLHADLAQPLLRPPGHAGPGLERPADAIVSTATFHWMTDQDALFDNLAAALRPGGQLVAQCGGAGNVATVVEALARTGDTWHPWHFATPGEARARLEAAGFEGVRAWLHDEPTTFASEDELEEFLTTVVLRAHLERRPAADRRRFVRAVAARLPSGAIDYVRLNLLATRAGT